jgi:hypothetical protein
MSTTPSQVSGPQLDASTLFVLAFVALFAYLDWITHRSLAETLILAGLAGGAWVYRRAIVERLGFQELVAGMSRGVRTVLAALPGVVYFMARGQGTSGAGGIVLVAMLGVIAAGAMWGPGVDLKLAAFYTARNRVLPRALRMLLALVAPVLVAFFVIHGSLADLPALFGGTTNHPATPVGRDGRFLFGTVLSAGVTWLLLREAPGGARGPVASPAPATAPEGGGAFRATHTAPADGLDAWSEPGSGPAAAHVDAGVPLAVVERRGDWARVIAENGWSGWVDGRRLGEGTR